MCRWVSVLCHMRCVQWVRTSSLLDAKTRMSVLVVRVSTVVSAWNQGLATRRTACVGWLACLLCAVATAHVCRGLPWMLTLACVLRGGAGRTVSSMWTNAPAILASTAPYVMTHDLGR